MRKSFSPIAGSHRYVQNLAMGRQVTGTTGGATDLCDSDLFSLMCAGDRAAAAEYLQRFERLIRVRASRYLQGANRRIFDSADVFATLSRRVDHMVVAGTLAPENPGQFISLLVTMARHCAITKARVASRLEGCRDEDREVALAYAERGAGWLSSDIDAQDFVDHLLSKLTDSTDREILLLWLQGESLTHIAALIGLSAAATRQRWARIRGKLRSEVEAWSA